MALGPPYACALPVMIYVMLSDLLALLTGAVLLTDPESVNSREKVRIPR